jgi:hypothetical protein
MRNITAGIMAAGRPERQVGPAKRSSWLLSLSRTVPGGQTLSYSPSVIPVEVGKAEFRILPAVQVTASVLGGLSASLRPSSREEGRRHSPLRGGHLENLLGNPDDNMARRIGSDAHDQAPPGCIERELPDTWVGNGRAGHHSVHARIVPRPFGDYHIWRHMGTISRRHAAPWARWPGTAVRVGHAERIDDEVGRPRSTSGRPGSNQFLGESQSKETAHDRSGPDRVKTEAAFCHANFRRRITGGDAERYIDIGIARHRLRRSGRRGEEKLARSKQSKGERDPASVLHHVFRLERLAG